MEIGVNIFSILLTFWYMEYVSGSMLHDGKDYLDGTNNSTLERYYTGAEGKLVLATADNLILMKGGRNYDEDERLPQNPHQGAEGRATFYLRKDRFYYCGPNNKRHYCRSLCYSMGYPTYVCGNVSCYCTF